MKKILLSSAILVAVGVLVVGGTIAFYNDTETSTGNIFVAGSVDLKIDHLAQTYNGADCETCSVNIWSSAATDVTGGTGAYPGPYPTSAVELTFIHPAWLPSIPSSSAKWIWVTDPVLVADTTNNAEYTFESKFDWNGSISGISLDLALIADNGYKIVFNGVTIIDELGVEFNYGALIDTSGVEALMLPEVQNGENTLEITVRNKAGIGDPAVNPAGLIFDLNIQRDEEECANDTSFQQACMLWSETDLDGSQSFFTFGDVKPADWGTNLISLHIEDNDAFVCLIPHDIVDLDNTLVDPEIALADTLAVGELSQFIEMFLWDDNGDGVYQLGEPVLVDAGTPLGDIPTEMIEMSLSGGGPGGYIGLAWCGGTQTGPTIALPNTPLGCDGNGMGNIAQTDSATASLTAYAVQQRNNEDFSCASVELESEESD